MVELLFNYGLALGMDYFCLKVLIRSLKGIIGDFFDYIMMLKYGNGIMMRAFDRSRNNPEMS